MRSSTKIVKLLYRLSAALSLGAALALGIGGAQAARLPAPITGADFPDYASTGDRAKIDLGMLLFYDKILSGNRNISCATCHHSLTDTGDGLSLPVGEGGRGLAVVRDTGEGPDAIHERVPRNAPFVFNLGAYEFTEMFHDGRVQVDPSLSSGYSSPAGSELPPGLDSVLAVQAMFPVTSSTEMAGQLTDNNDVADALENQGVTGVWEVLAQRLRAIPEYVELFKLAYPEEIDESGDNITYVDAANAIAAYEDYAFRAIDSPFDRYLRGDRHALSKSARDGMKLFYGKAGCSQCHSGPLQTDHGYHSVAMPQIGPGKGDFQSGDFGREQVTHAEADRYKFRTPSLRNTALTGPWGHDGAYNSLEAVVRHHLDSEESLYGYDRDQVVLPLPHEGLDDVVFEHMDNPANLAAIAASSEIDRIDLTGKQIEKLIAFLNALTDPASLDLRTTVPTSVPSGLPLAD